MFGIRLVRRASFRVNPNDMVKLYSGPSPFEIFTKMSNQLGTFNFGHGSPDSHPPQFLKDALVAAMNDTKNQHQYCRPLGHPEFAAQISEEFSPSFERKLDPVWEISTGIGATGMIANTLYAFLRPGDEMVCFEPSFLGYAPLFHIVGPKVNWVNFRTNKQTQKFEFDREAFRRAVNSKTKIVFLNNPHNPAGHLFSREELEFIAETVRQFPDIIVIADEVYEKFVFGSRKFTRFATLPGMWERTVSIYSSGKVFSCTGWRVGFSIAPSYLTKQIGSWQTWSVYCLNTLSAKAVELGMKYAVTHPYEGYPNYYEWLRSTFEWRANEISKIVRASPLDLKMFEPDGGYFTVANIEETIKKMPTKYFYKEQAKGSDKPLAHFQDWKQLDQPDFTPDSAMSIYFTKELGFTTVPFSAFFDNNPEGNILDYKGTEFVRFALCKNNDFILRWGQDMKKRGLN